MADVSVAIVGAGHAGAQCAIALRERGYKDSIAVISDEPGLPYERPPLSKGYLTGDLSFDRMLLRKPEFWASREVQLLQPSRVVAVNPLAHDLHLEGGATLRYSKLVWAAGGTPRALTCPGHDLGGIHYIRTRADVDRIKNELSNAQRIAVIGGGYVGLEAAAALTKLGKRVVILEAQTRLLPRVTGPVISSFLDQHHRAHGVDIRTSASVSGLRGSGGRVTTVELSSGELIDVDMVIVGIGIVPNVEPLLAAGAQGTNGVLVNGQCQTTLADVYAIGDCALHHNRFADGAAIRIESVQNAADQAVTAAKNILGEAASYDAVPWFWSNQYDIRLQTVGLAVGHDRTVTVGDPATGSFAVIYLRSNTVAAVDCVNSTKSYVAARKLIGKPLCDDDLDAIRGDTPTAVVAV